MFFLYFLILLIFVLFCPIDLYMRYVGSDFLISISFLFLKFDLLKKKEKKNKKSKNKNVKKKSKINLKKNIKFWLELLKILIFFVKMILKKLEIKKINLFLKISSDEAKSCAVRFASISSLIFLILKITKLESRVKDFNLKVYPDFLSEKTSANFEILLRLKIFWILYFLLCGTLEYVKIRKLK